MNIYSSSIDELCQIADDFPGMEARIPMAALTNFTYPFNVGSKPYNVGTFQVKGLKLS